MQRRPFERNFGCLRPKVTDKAHEPQGSDKKALNGIPAG